MFLSHTRNLFLAVTLAWAGASSEAIKIKGSDTMLDLTKKWGDKYKQSHADAVFTIQGGGSGNGITALINGAADIALASRPMKSSERDKLKERYSSLGTEIKTAMDGIAIYVNPAVTVNELTIAQVKDIFLGTTTNWKQVGGPDLPIQAYSREATSGTHGFFVDNALGGKEFASSVQVKLGAHALVKAISGDKGGIGYSGLATHAGVKTLKIKNDAGSAAIEPTAATIRSSTYPLSRYLYFYLKAKPDGAINDFITFVLGPDGQALATAEGFVSLK